MEAERGDMGIIIDERNGDIYVESGKSVVQIEENARGRFTLAQTRGNPAWGVTAEANKVAGTGAYRPPSSDGYIPRKVVDAIMDIATRVPGVTVWIYKA